MSYLLQNYNAKKTGDKLEYDEKSDPITPGFFYNSDYFERGVEKGISGYSNYMYKKSNVSRSGSAFQAPKRIRSGSFKAMDYVSQIIKEFQVGVRI